jgi:hypothetical protein
MSRHSKVFHAVIHLLIQLLFPSGKVGWFCDVSLHLFLCQFDLLYNLSNAVDAKLVRN